MFFPDGHSTLGKEKDMQFLLSCYNGEEIGDIVKLPSGEEVPFTVQNYAMSGGFSRIKLYLKTCRLLKKDRVSSGSDIEEELKANIEIEKGKQQHGLTKKQTSAINESCTSVLPETDPMIKVDDEISFKNYSLLDVDDVAKAMPTKLLDGDLR